MRFSYQRDSIYKSICGVDTHPTAADIFTMIKPQIKNISLATIYRNLAQLVQKQMIRELNINGISHYDGNMSSHQHYVCKKCGSIMDCYAKNDWNVERIKKTKEFDIQEIHIQFSGVCQDCKPN